MDYVQTVVSFVEAQPWAPALPFIGAVGADWGLGSWVAGKTGEFKREKVWDWVKTTVGWQQASAIAASAALVYFTKGQQDAMGFAIAAVVVNGAAFVTVMNDVRVKAVQLFGLYFNQSQTPAPAAPEVRGVPDQVPTDAKQ